MICDLDHVRNVEKYLKDLWNYQIIWKHTKHVYVTSVWKQFPKTQLLPTSINAKVYQWCVQTVPTRPDKILTFYVVKKKLGTPHHLLKSLQSLSTYNSRRIGSTPPPEFTLRRKNTPSPSSTPSRPRKAWNHKKSLLSKYPLPSINE